MADMYAQCIRQLQIQGYCAKSGGIAHSTKSENVLFQGQKVERAAKITRSLLDGTIRGAAGIGCRAEDIA